MQYEERLSAALGLVCRHWPYLSPAALRIRPIWVWDEEEQKKNKELVNKGEKKSYFHRIGVDKSWRMYINPEWVEDIPIPLLALFIASHEIRHLLNKHFLRFDGCNPDLSNISQDMAIANDYRDYCEAAMAIQKSSNNQSTSFITFVPPDPILDNVVFPHLFKDKDGNPLPDGLASEEYYLMLLTSPNIKFVDVSQICQCGSGGGGRPLPFEIDDPSFNPGDKGMKGDANDPVSSEEAEVITAIVAKEIQHQNSKQIGTVPNSLVRFAEELLAPPKVRWQDKLKSNLRSFLTRVSGSYDWSWTKPNKRHSGSRIIFPSTIDYRPNVVWVLDTSGSMGTQDYKNALSEGAGIVQALQTSVRVITCDVYPHEPVVLRSKNEIKYLPLIGGGGTDMTVGIDYALQLKPTPNIIVLFTDGYTPWPHEPIKNTKVLVVITGPYNGDNIPPFLEVVYLDNYDKSDEN